jgi:UDP-2,3-diacylglucosamine pyrophosphatase LpxH
LRTIVVSDVHLGCKDSDASAFESFLDELLDQRPDKLILLGDIFDFWRRSDADLLLENQQIIEKILKLPIVYIQGNHDYSMLKLSQGFPKEPGFEVYSCYTFQNQTSRFVLKHGYDLEVFTSMETLGLEAYEAFSEAMCHAGEIGGNIASWVWAFVGLVKGELTGSARTMLMNAFNKPAELRSTLEKVDEFAKSPSRAILLGLKPNDVLVFGHTHRPFKEANAINTGSWVAARGKEAHTYMEITDQSFDLKTWPVSDKARKMLITYRRVSAHRKTSKRSGKHG